MILISNLTDYDIAVSAITNIEDILNLDLEVRSKTLELLKSKF